MSAGTTTSGGEGVSEHALRVRTRARPIANREPRGCTAAHVRGSGADPCLNSRSMR